MTPLGSKIDYYHTDRMQQIQKQDLSKQNSPTTWTRRPGQHHKPSCVHIQVARATPTEGAEHAFAVLFGRAN
ncbi:hypothetical protein AMECASPLE_022460 [Ameca splendens]|uniref:Uncharacterized protein n=1 Tax=Ameca splendens TaxID=208324 RepID=A0ABV0ZPI0_9TELE